MTILANEIRTGDPRGFNKGRTSKFRVGSRIRQTDLRIYRLKSCEINNKDEDSSPKTFNDKKKTSRFLSEIQTTY